MLGPAESDRQQSRDVAGLKVPSFGKVCHMHGEQPRLIDASGAIVLSVADYLRTMFARGASPATLRSYALALLRWWRFLGAIGVLWNEATGVDVRDFVLWMRFTPRPSRADQPNASGVRGPARTAGQGYAGATINHNLAVLSSYYGVVLGADVRNPVPGAGERLHAHHNPMERFRFHRRAAFRQKAPITVPRGLSDVNFDALFASMVSDRDRALLAFYISTGARASELLAVTEDHVDIGRQVIGVHRKGSGRLQWLPASPDSFVWLRLYQQRQSRLGHERALWLTRREPHRPLTYSAMRRVLQRANARLGTSWTLHDLRHTAAHRMIADSRIALTDVQWVLGHAHLTTTQIYLQPREDEVIERMRAHHTSIPPRPAPPAPPMSGYEPVVLQTLLGRNVDVD